MNMRYSSILKAIYVILWLLIAVPTAYSADGPLNDMERWMNEWMSLTKMPIGALHVTRFKDPTYIVTKPISWVPNAGQPSYAKVTVPKGFVTDFASIPQVFWSLLRPDGDYTYAAIIHDYLYWTQKRSREECDEILKLAMEDFGVASSKVFAIHKAVRVGGASAWSDNSELRKKGEQRILRKFPQDPRITWAEWKTDPDVFAR